MIMEEGLQLLGASIVNHSGIHPAHSFPFLLNKPVQSAFFGYFGVLQRLLPVALQRSSSTATLPISGYFPLLPMAFITFC